MSLVKPHRIRQHQKAEKTQKIQSSRYFKCISLKINWGKNFCASVQSNAAVARTGDVVCQRSMANKKLFVRIMRQIK